MTDVNRYRAGEMSSTALMQRAMEEAHAVPQGEGKDVKWHADHESMDQARARMHDEPARQGAEMVGKAAEHVAKHYVEHEAKHGLAVLIDKVSPGYANAVHQMSKATAAAASALALPAAGAAGVAAAVWEVVHAMNQQDELEHKSDVDGMEGAVTSLLDLDMGFRQAENAKHPSTNSEATIRLFVDLNGKPTAFGSVHLPELQAAADAGSRAALDAMKCGGREAYFAAHPDAKERLANDVAFNKGFENVMFLAGRREDEKVRAVESAINARNVSANVAVPVRG